MTTDTVQIARDGLDLTYQPIFLDAGEQAACFAAVREQTPWECPRVRVYGRWHAQPRLTAWFADAGLRYRYSGVEHAPRPWTPLLGRLRDAVASVTGVPFNAVLLNFYRGGSDTVGWHSDDEPALGEAPSIASVSLGSERRFRLRPHPRRRAAGEPAVAPVELMLGPGSLLVMRGATQRCWQHCLPRCRSRGPRINLTFRRLEGQ